MKTDPAGTRVIDLPIARIWMDSDRVVHMVFKAESAHGVEEARQVVQAHDTLADGTPCPVLADITAVTAGADRAAREFYVSPEGSHSKTAMAMVTTSPFQKMLGNFFFRMNKPPYPSRMFNDAGSALSWLAEQ
jgi:hypothetical protein